MHGYIDYDLLRNYHTVTSNLTGAIHSLIVYVSIGCSAVTLMGALI